MNRPHSMVAVPLAVVLLLFHDASAEERKSPSVTDPAGHVIKGLGADGTADAAEPPGLPGSRAAQSLSECAPGAAGGDVVELRTSRGDGFTVDACGRVRRDPGRTLPESVTRDRKAAGSSSVAPRVTIDRMTTRGSWYGDTYAPGGTILLLGSADTYFLSNNSSWQSGAGSYYDYSTRLDRVELSGNTIRYYLLPPASFLYQQTDYDGGDHSAQGTLAAAGPLVIEAVAGSTTGVMRGNALIVSNDATWYGEPRFNFYSSIVGSVVPFEQTYTLQGGQTWLADTFTRSFDYANQGHVDFANPVSVPAAVELTVHGPAQVPVDSTVQFTARVRYENDVVRDVTAETGWDVEPASFAAIQEGLLTTTAVLPRRQVRLTIRATYAEGDADLAAQKTVVCTANHSVDGRDRWPMYQGNARHTGYLPITLEPAFFAQRWQRNVGGSFALNPPAGGDGKVFVTLRTYFNDVPTLFALDATSGQTLWSKSFGGVFSVNPPSYAYGTVYVQTGNHSSDTWLRAYDAGSGEFVFQAPHAAQWERYYAPTIDGGKVYVNGGVYGGMHGFDAFSGSSMWFLDLPQYDQWTPAVSGSLAYSYVGEYQPGLYAADRASGALVFFIPDANFDWNGWSMDLAPVIGDRGDVIVAHDGRLISFDVAARTMRWELDRDFEGQPSVARDTIYAVDGGQLVVLDELTGATLWSWQPAEEGLTAPLIVTNTHVLASTATRVHAIDLRTRQSVWSSPVAGLLALADRTLYVASSNGVLTAIAMLPGGARIASPSGSASSAGGMTGR